MEYNVEDSVESQPTFRRNMPPSSGLKSKSRKIRRWSKQQALPATCSSKTSIDFF
jgi:hypothetical protein